WLCGEFPLPRSLIQKMLVNDCDLPSGYDSEEYELFQGVPGRLLDDGDIIELGDRNIKAIHTPGHSPGHMCFWDETNRFMFTGDLIYKGVLYANYPSTDPQAYLDSVKKVSTYKPARIFPGHYSLDISAELIERIKNALLNLDVNKLLYHGSGRFDYEDWSILL
ncbi:MAG: MBL fold metallo-hydrolase, partial [Clostridia bacterium]|nr:MBL fold metallo-hydrolase [Clostridia bacterium]